MKVDISTSYCKESVFMKFYINIGIQYTSLVLLHPNSRYENIVIDLNTYYVYINQCYVAFHYTSNYNILV